MVCTGLQLLTCTITTRFEMTYGSFNMINSRFRYDHLSSCGLFRKYLASKMCKEGTPRRMGYQRNAWLSNCSLSSSMVARSFRLVRARASTCLAIVHCLRASMDREHAWIARIHGSQACMAREHPWLASIHVSHASMAREHPWLAGIHGSRASMDRKHPWIACNLGLVPWLSWWSLAT